MLDWAGILAADQSITGMESDVSFARWAVAMTAAGLLAAQPCAAAGDGAGWEQRRMSAFAGVNLRMPLGGAKPARPSARLQLTTGYQLRDARTGALRTFQPKGLEIGAAGNGAPSFYLNGRHSAELRKSAALTGSTSDTVWIVLGVALVAVAVLVLSNSSELPGPPV